MVDRLLEVNALQRLGKSKTEKPNVRVFDANLGSRAATTGRPVPLSAKSLRVGRVNHLVSEIGVAELLEKLSESLLDFADGTDAISTQKWLWVCLTIFYDVKNGETPVPEHTYIQALCVH
eukprot:g12892.t1